MRDAEHHLPQAFVGALLAATTGVVAASVISMGLISLPIMLRYGYDLDCDQIAAALDSTEEAARQAASSGVRRLRRRIT